MKSRDAFLKQALIGAALAAFGLLLHAAAPGAGGVDAGLFSGLRWRLIGPFRAGRVTAVAGIPGDSTVYYMGTPGGGVWKTTDAGRVWKPIFDSQHVASIGAVTLAPSDPNNVYVGTGEQTPGKGVYKSTDAGASWANIGLADTHYIQAIIVDPHDPNVLVVGATGDPAASANRGVFKTTDGGSSWTKTLYKDDMSGVMDLCADPGDPRTLFATLMRRPAGPTAPTQGAYSGIFESNDEGATWRELTGHGLPESNKGRIGIAVAPGKQGRVVYAIMHQGFFRSEDGGASWQKSTTDPRVIGNTYFSRIFVDPANADTLYVVQTSLYRSTDGGHTFEAYRGAPGGDDYHVLWIDPHNSQRMLLGVDQGATISVDAGRTWTSWYNQPTGQFYHLSTDLAFPYRVYATQQDSGTAGILSRSDYGQITNGDWFPVGGFENGFIAADPTNPNFVYSQGWYGSVVRFDKATRQVATVFVRSPKYRTGGAPPLMFAPQNPHVLYYATQFLLQSDDATNWREMSPDLAAVPNNNTEPHTASNAEHPPATTRNATITALSPSTLSADVIWAGTSNGLVQLTQDGGKTWRNMTPPEITRASIIGSLEAGHHDAGSAYLSTMRRLTNEVYAARTRDAGKTWQSITDGLPASEPIRVIREDPVRAGLLYAGTQTGIYVSFDDGDHWQSLQLNLPTATVTDLAVHDNDLVASTYGRALWILDDVSPLRELTAAIAAESAHLFRPAAAMRVRWDNWPDTPLPPETPAGNNPPNGAILNYYLARPLQGEVTLTIYDEHGSLVRRLPDSKALDQLPPPNIPAYWFAPPAVPPSVAGVNRFVWDLRYPPPHTLPYGYFGERQEYTEYTLPNDAIVGETPRQQPQGPLAVPGTYTIELQVNDRKYREQLIVKLDPRLTASSADLQDQLDLSRRIMTGMEATYQAFNAVAGVRAKLNVQSKSTDASVSALDKKLDDIQNGARDNRGLGTLNRDLTRNFYDVNSADIRPTPSAAATVDEACRNIDSRLEQLRQLKAENKAVLLSALDIPDRGCGRK